jgi:hypothetical protein
VRDLVVGIDEDDVIAGRVNERRLFPSSMLRPLSGNTLPPYRVTRSGVPSFEPRRPQEFPPDPAGNPGPGSTSDNFQ